MPPSCCRVGTHSANHRSRCGDLRMSYAALDRMTLAKLVPELLLSGQLIDRSGMAHCIAAFGRETMAQIAIEEWMAASPVYTKRMRTALKIDGDGVADMF